MKNKMNLFAMGILLTLPVKGFTSNYNLPEIGKDTLDPQETPFIINENIAEFPGGEFALENYIRSNIQYPSIARQQHISGKVIASVEINTSGNITNVNIIQGIGGGCDEEVIRLLYAMPAWKPANQAGHSIKTKRIFSFNFKA